MVDRVHDPLKLKQETKKKKKIQNTAVDSINHINIEWEYEQEILNGGTKEKC